MSISNIIEHRNDYDSLIIHEDYLVLCQGNHCQALLLGVLEQCREKASSIEKESCLFFPLTYNDFGQATYNLYGRSTIIVALNALEQARLIEKQPFETTNVSTYAYRLNIPVLEQRLQALPEKASPQRLRKHRSKRVFSSKKITSIQALRTQNDVLNRFGGDCAYCQQREATTWDHVIPPAQGGETVLSNLVPCCAFCNSSKGDTDVLSWMQKRKITPSAILLEVINIAQKRKGGEV